ncbi:family 43 glycosylhydrolase [Actinomadura formosensis]|uniref:family 43 glycosylhydrolase n=1 Tax=Actinomadura formosensis TaxID=60706 RepID=UPI003D8DB8B0
MNSRPTGPVVPLVAGAAITGLIALLILLAGSLVPGLRAGSSGGTAPARGAAPVTPAPAGTATPVTAPGYSPAEPVIRDSFADPAVIKAGNTYYAYGTNAGVNMPVESAPTVTGPWERLPGDGLAHLPSWAAEGRTWAPEVVPPGPGNGGYLLYFSARVKNRDLQCIGVATSASPAGPFAALEGGPLVCPAELGGAIDASSFIERDGTRYLLYKTDARTTAAIYLVRLSPDGLYLAGPPTEIMGRGGNDPVLVESPALVHRGGKYVLLYSAGWYFETNYQTRYAVASSLAGPYVKAPDPVQSTGGYDGKVKGPGGASIVTDAAGDHLVFHGILEFHGDSQVTRGMYVASLGWDGPRPVLRGVPVRYEAENARIGTCATVVGRPRASAGKALAPLAQGGCQIELDAAAPETGRYTVQIRYANRSGRPGTQQLIVNGRAAVPVNLRTTGEDEWASAKVEVDLVSGQNVLALRQVTGAGQLDYFEVG